MTVTYRTSIEQINHRAQELVEAINLSRASDKMLMESYHQKLSDKVLHIFSCNILVLFIFDIVYTVQLSEKFQHLNDQMVTVYEINSKMFDEKMTELSAVLNNCHRLHQELKEANRALAHLRDNF